ncbi:signal transduction histidine kinase [Curtobacterium sp. PhB172]|uniref:sensor histidine kinase n=1 Tax=unclassified Curtobacterium TaxID=257496 RepID=UPI000F47141A|nr:MULTISPECIES: HAMP domain-containing sensor histidine kinase [unclassified Curtobacterium]ROQ17711.1 signal transduction histidine kinase [Curtobacterium sp. PhB171]ROQ29044.1 signal transduction histidine kinase [Curtobacterium sp. PhB170]ROS45812.1 signal transduction histidine kinase [Curtobacterium sp. PhB131]ROS65365.1 signal transduction histidine kinase [Curtobacterium sp. PhB172]ROS67886.1 signal transduction histidine kinase [Curtobacterium sp. PhB141]
MRRLRRTWSIRARTALVFALASMALTAAVLVFVNVTSISSISTRMPGSDTATGPALPAPVSPESRSEPDPSSTAQAQSTMLVAVVATQQWQWSAVGIAGAGVLAGGVGWFVSRRMLRPIDRITATTQRISASNLHERIGLGGPDDELRRLSRTVDDLLGRLETAFESQRRFVAHASHELRTPLAVQRAAMQIGLPDDADPDDVRRTRDELLEQNRRTERLVESLLLLAEADRGLAGATEPVDLDGTVDDVVSGVGDAVHEAGVTLSRARRHGPPVGVRGEPTLVRQLLVNLVGNAVEYNVPGGFVRVTTDVGGFTVENSGPVVPGSVAPDLVEPFRRCPDSAAAHRHSGLGLSIVAAVAQAHGWRLSIAARDGGGLRVRVDVSST